MTYRIPQKTDFEENKKFVKLFGAKYRAPVFFLGFRRSNVMSL